MTDVQKLIYRDVSGINKFDGIELDSVAEMTLERVFVNYLDSMENVNYHEYAMETATDDAEFEEESERFEVNLAKREFYLEELKSRIIGKM